MPNKLKLFDNQPQTPTRPNNAPQPTPPSIKEEHSAVKAQTKEVDRDNLQPRRLNF